MVFGICIELVQIFAICIKLVRLRSLIRYFCCRIEGSLIGYGRIPLPSGPEIIPASLEVTLRLDKKICAIFCAYKKTELGFSRQVRIWTFAWWYRPNRSCKVG